MDAQGDLDYLAVGPLEKLEDALDEPSEELLAGVPEHVGNHQILVMKGKYFCMKRG